MTERPAFRRQRNSPCRSPLSRLPIHHPFPVHLQRGYAELGYREGDFPISEALAREELSLPMYPELTEEQIRTVVTAVRNATG
jgi:dTDP-4-amino-4,6-dideoxygalactose transaminase